MQLGLSAIAEHLVPIALHRRRQDNGLLYCSCAHCSTPYTAQYTLVLVYSKYYSSKLHALPNNLPKPTVNKGRIAGCIMQ